MKRVIAIIPAFIVITLLFLRLYYAHRAEVSIREAWRRGRESGLLLNTITRREGTPGHVEGLASYGAALSLMPSGAAIDFSCIPSTEDLLERPQGALLDEETKKIVSLCSENYHRSIELLEQVSENPLEYELSLFLLCDVDMRKRGIDPLGLDCSSRSLPGVWSLYSLSRARALLNLDAGSSEEALRSCRSALAVLNYYLYHRSLESESLRQRALIGLANTVALILRRGDPSIGAMEDTLSAFMRVPYWRAVLAAVQATCYDDLVGVFEARKSNFLSRPFHTLEQARYLKHMTHCYEGLLRLRAEAKEGKPWAGKMKELLSGFYLDGYLEKSVEAKIAIDLICLELAVSINEQSIQGRAQDTLAAGLRRDPWSNAPYEELKNGCNHSYRSIGSGGEGLHLPIDSGDGF